MTETVALPLSLHAKGYGFVRREETGSTNADALDAGRAGHHAPCWFVAGSQVVGRGRSGRHWLSPPGNLYASLLLRNPCEMAAAPQLGFITGVALHDAIAQVTGIGAQRLQLKWPNDILLDGKKLVGLLLEAQSMGSEHIVAIGCGVNVARRPEGVPYPIAALRDVKENVTTGDVFSALSLAFDALLSLWQKAASRTLPERFAPIRALWLERAAGIGQPASVTLPQGKVSGTIAGIDSLGRLELRTDTGIEVIDAGDLFFPGHIS